MCIKQFLVEQRTNSVVINQVLCFFFLPNAACFLASSVSHIFIWELRSIRWIWRSQAMSGGGWFHGSMALGPRRWGYPGLLARGQRCIRNTVRSKSDFKLELLENLLFSCIAKTPLPVLHWLFLLLPLLNYEHIYKTQSSTPSPFLTLPSSEKSSVLGC